MPLSSLNPPAVWRHFQTLCSIPRASKHEAAVRDALCEWARAHALDFTVDATGNLILRKPASPGYEDHPGVILQGHLDMVCQKNTGSAHDFFHDAIRTEIRDGWVVADETTLGADNGIGVALALAVLEAETLAHPALEVLLTVDEEAGMGGVLGLAPDALQGRQLINLDTEDWGEIYLGCAGGADVNVSRTYATEPAPADHVFFVLNVQGLHGGHSGIDIHRERGNAIKLLVRLLRTLESRLGLGLRLAQLDGGNARNALPREAQALVALPLAQSARMASCCADFERGLREELAGIDDALNIRLTPGAADQRPGVMPREDQNAILNALNAAPHGVWRMSQRVAGVVETSNNLGMVRVGGGTFSANLLVRSLHDGGLHARAAEIASLFTLIGAEVVVEGRYPGWTPNPDSPLLAHCLRIYEQAFGVHAAVKVIHAGLECGILAAKFPHLDMISLGPDIRGAHAPGERVDIASVERLWQLLTALLATLPGAPA